MRRNLKSVLVFMLIAVMSIQCTIFASAAIYAGDMNGDGKIDSGDARDILRIAVGLDWSNYEKLADVDGNGSITAEDARIVLRLAVGLEKTENYNLNRASSTGELLSASQIKPIVQSLVERRIFIMNYLFGWRAMNSGTPENNGLDRYEITDPAYKTVDDVYAAVRNVFTASYADKLLTMIKNAKGGPEYRLAYTDMYGDINLFSMYKEENGKLYFYIEATEPLLSEPAEYGDITIISQNSEEITVSLDLFFLEYYDEIITHSSSTAVITIVNENGEWKMDSYYAYSNY